MLLIAVTALGSLALAGKALVEIQQSMIDEARAETRGYF